MNFPGLSLTKWWDNEDGGLCKCRCASKKFSIAQHASATSQLVQRSGPARRAGSAPAANSWWRTLLVALSLPKQRRSARWNCGEVTGMFHQSEMFPFERWWRCFIAFNVAGNVMSWNAFSFSLSLLFPETQSIVVKSQWLSLVEH